MRFVISALLILFGLFVLGVATVGIFRFSTMLNRIHAAAKCDTLGALLVLSGLAVMSGFTLFSLKMLLSILFLWLGNPVASHLVARAEVQANPNLGEFCDLMELRPDGTLTLIDGGERPAPEETEEHGPCLS